MENPALLTLQESARLAPSGDNTQPWRFEVDASQRCVRLHLDPYRDLSPMNAGQVMARIALGTALENMVQAAQHNDWQYETECSESFVACTLLAEYPAGKIPAHVLNRTSNRKQYSPSAISSLQLKGLREALEPDQSRATWVTDPQDRQRICKLIGQADSILLSIESARKAFLEKVRFDQPVRAVVEEGLSVGSLELTPIQRLGLRAMPSIPDALVKNCGGPSMFRQAAYRLAKSAAGFCLVTSEQTGYQRAFEVGRVFQRAWLALTEQHIESQPMMSIPVLKNMLSSPPLDFSESEQRRAVAIIQELDDFLKQRFECIGTAGALLRFGICDRPTVRTARLSIA